MDFIIGIIIGAIFSPVIIKLIKVAKDKLSKKIDDI